MLLTCKNRPCVLFQMGVQRPESCKKISPAILPRFCLVTYSTKRNFTVYKTHFLAFKYTDLDVKIVRQRKTQP